MKFSNQTQRWWLLVPVLVLFSGAFILPVAEVFFWSFGGEGEVFMHYERALAPGPYRTILFNTLRLSMAVGCACVLIGYPAAYYLVSRPSKHQSYLMLLILTPLWVSVLIRTYGWIVVLGREGLINTMLIGLGWTEMPLALLYNRGAVYVAMVQVLLPVAILMMYTSMIAINRSLMLAARTMGASPWAAFCRIFLPLSMNGAITAGVLTFIISLGFFITPALVGGPRDALISNIIVAQIKETLDWNLGAALGVVLVVAGFSIVGVILLLLRRFTQLTTDGGTR